MADVTMPQLGETVTEGTVTRWFKQVGDEIALDEALFEVSTDKVDTEVPSPVAGVVAEILAGEGDLVEVGQVLARVGDAADISAAPPQAPLVEQVSPASPPPQAPPVEQAHTETPDESLAASVAVAAVAAESPVLSPVVRRLINENGIDPTTLSGTGRGGRITRADVEQAIRARSQATPASAPAAEPPPAPIAEPPPAAVAEPPTAPAVVPESAPVTASASPAVEADPEHRRESRRSRRSKKSSVPAVVPRAGDSVVPLNNIRRRTAEHMVMSKQTSPHVLTAIEVDYEGVETVRRRAKQAWKSEEGCSLTYLPFIAGAVIEALRDYLHLNASFGGAELVVQ